MVRNVAPPAVLIAVGALLLGLQFVLPNATQPVQRIQPAPSPSPQPGASVASVIWREFRPGERQTGPATTVKICAAALQRAPARSALVIRMCNSMPTTPKRRYQLGWDDLVIRAELPGGMTLAYDMLNYVETRDGGTSFSEGALSDNTAPLASVRVVNLTDIVLVINAQLPVGLPTIEVRARYTGTDSLDVEMFASLGADLEQVEAARVALAPDWANARY